MAQTWMRRVLPLALPGALAVGCAGTHAPAGFETADDGGIESSPGARALVGLVSLAIDPPSAELTLRYDTPGAVAEQAFRGTGTFDDGSARDVTSLVAWSTDDVPGASAGNGRFRSQTPGPFVVRAFGNGVTGAADARVKLTGDLVRSAASAGTKAKLDAAPQGNGPTIAYPIDGALFPASFGATEIQVATGAASQSVARVAFEGDFIDLRVYDACATIAPGGCALTLDAPLVIALAGASAGATMTTRVRLAAPDGSALGESAPIDVRWTFSSLSGALYYWRAIDHDVKTAVSRFDLDVPSRPPENFFTNDPDSPPLPTGAQHPCVGCHAISQDGTKIGLTFGGSVPSSFALIDVATKKPIATRNTDDAGFATMTAFSPNGARLVNAFRGQLVLRAADASLAALEGPLFASIGEPLSLPAWSADGKKLAFVGWQPGKNGAADSITGDLVRGGEIFVADSDGSTFATSPRLLVPRVPSRTETYPALSDDGALVAFVESRCDGPPTPGPYGNDACDGYDDPSAHLRLVSSGGGPPVDLARASGAESWTSSWPRFGPRQGTFRGKRLYWIAFSSRRPYGLRLPGSTTGTSKPQLWVAAITLGDGPPATDPSFAPVWISGQDNDMQSPTGNHVPQWVSTFVPIK